MITDSVTADAIRGQRGAPALRVERLSKTFPGTRALIDASIEIRAGEVHALVGQNGSGKSTLIKTLAGYHTPDPGAVAELAGEPFALGHTVPDGLRFVHQDLGLVLELNAMDNLALRGDFIRGFGGRVRWADQIEETYRILERFDVELDIHRPLAEASPVQRTVVAIAGALRNWQGGGGVLVLDEPTAVLPHDEVERLLAMVREVRRSGTSVLYVSHRLDEIFEIADRVTVLRAGRVVQTLPVSDVDQRGLAQLMVGADVDPDYRAPVAARPDSPVVLELRDIRARRLHGLNLDVHRGEILGVAGLAGDGVNDLPYVIAGYPRHPTAGRIRLPQRSSGWTDVADAHRLGIPLVPADRAHEAIIPDFAVSENMTLSVLGSLGSRGKLSMAAEQKLVERWTQRLGVVTASSDAMISTLSGGNQQKVVVARCLARDPELLVLSEPTAGVDIGTRVAIYELLAGLARDGLTVIVSSSDLGDLLAICTRIVVLRDGRVGAELAADGLTEHALVNAIEGERSADGANDGNQ
ncbi:MAG TPA: sugar ABC transporter ATP-binding protein [Solirubrobacteraceae bacterium]|nr:sugar ABC transporter ATP-binding protein [Solirubrobacteraceae bacterium]